jgi:hypothetical protein
MPIRKYLGPRNTFSPEMVEMMGEAFRETCDSLNISVEDPTRRERVAQLIVTLTEADGDADPLALRDRAVRILNGLVATPPQAA